MNDVQFTDKISVELVDSMGNDLSIARAARVSTGSAINYSTDEGLAANAKLIDYLMRNKHGSPFEHVTATFRVTAPIFVWREHMRHRVLSYNEESGRYKELEPVFYVPQVARVQSGKPGHYTIAEALELTNTMQDHIQANSRNAYRLYQQMLSGSVAREVARMVLPVNIMSSAYVSGNLRGFMKFMELRLPTNAQLEIRMVAEQYSAALDKLCPDAMASFDAAGLVCP